MAQTLDALAQEWLSLDQVSLYVSFNESLYVYLSLSRMKKLATKYSSCKKQTIPKNFPNVFLLALNLEQQVTI